MALIKVRFGSCFLSGSLAAAQRNSEGALLCGPPSGASSDPSCSVGGVLSATIAGLSMEQKELEEIRGGGKVHPAFVNSTSGVPSLSVPHKRGGGKSLHVIEN